MSGDSLPKIASIMLQTSKKSMIKNNKAYQNSMYKLDFGKLARMKENFLNVFPLFKTRGFNFKVQHPLFDS